eukprot:6206575-Pleurochrysis_carterae.AAC.1
MLWLTILLAPPSEQVLPTAQPSTLLGVPHPPSANKELPGLKASVTYSGNLIAVDSDKFSDNVLQHKLGKDICPAVAIYLHVSQNH